MCVYREDSTNVVRDITREGDLLPLDRGAGGRVRSAFSGATGKLYDEVRRHHVCALVGDSSPDLAGVCAPVFGQHDQLIGALTITGPSSRLTAARAAVGAVAASPGRRPE